MPQPSDRQGDLSALEVAAYVGRRLDAAGFVLGDPFDMLLRHLSAEYLSAAWKRLHPVLSRYGVEPDNLSWGWLHNGETRISGLEQPAPSDFTGWTTVHLDRIPFTDDALIAQLDKDLREGCPALRCAATWRSKRWMIAPDDFPLAMRLIHELWTDDSTEWSPHTILWGHKRVMDKFRGTTVQAREIYTTDEDRLQDAEVLAEPWRKVAAAIEAADQPQLVRALAEARATYSPLGYSILLRGFRTYVQAADNVEVHLP